MARNKKKSADKQIAPVRFSHAGHDYHFVWAARRALRILHSGNELCAISIEDASPLDFAEDADADSTLVIDVAEYHGAETPDQANAIKYIQLKYSTQNTDTVWTPAALTGLKNGKPFGIVGQFSTLFQGRIASWGQKWTYAVVQMEFVTNRPISAEAIEALGVIAEGRDPASLRAPLRKACDRFKKAICLEGDELRAFAHRLVLRGNEGTRYAEARALEQETNLLLLGSDIAVTARLKEMVREKALPGAADDPTIREQTVLEALGVTSKRELLPCPSRFEDVSDALEREQESGIADAILSYEGHTLIHASGGVGKSVLANRLPLHMPDGSVSILFDGFAGGSFNDPREPRHRYDRGLVHIVNEIAAHGLCDPIIPQAGRSADNYLHTFDHRARQAASNIRSKYPDAVLLILLDAIDNSQIAANEAGDERDCFARGLMLGKPIEGCRIVAFCRTERRHYVPLPESVNQIRLDAFSLKETSVLVRTAFSDVSDRQIEEFHRLTSANPRFQANEIATSVGTFVEVLQQLGPNPKSIDDAIGQQLERSLKNIREHGTDSATVNRLCTALAVLPPRVPISVLNEACGISKEQIRSFASDFGRSFWLQDDAIQFRDEPTDTWFRQNFGNNPEIVVEICSALEKGISEQAYAQSALPRLLFLTERYDELLALALDTTKISGMSEFEERRIILQRTEFALKAALRSHRWGDVIKLLLLAGEYVSGSTRQEGFVAEHAGVFSRLADPLTVQDFVLSRPARDWFGRAHARSAALLSVHPRFGNEARSFLHQAGLWLKEWARQSDAHRSQHPIENSDIENLIAAILNLHGPELAVAELSGWSPKEIAFTVARRIGLWLLEGNATEQLAAFFSAAKDNLLLRLGLLSVIGPDQPVISTEELLETQKRLITSADSGLLELLNNESLEWPGIISLAEALASGGAKTESAAILEKFDVHIPAYAPHRPADERNDERELILQHRCLRAALKNESVAFEDLLPEKLRKKAKDRKFDSDSDLNSFKITYGALLPFYQLRAEVIVGHSRDRDIGQALAEAASSARISDWEWRRDWSFVDLPGLMARAWLGTLLLADQATAVNSATLKGWMNARRSGPNIRTWTIVAELASRASQIQADCLYFADQARTMIDESHLDADSAAGCYLEIARAVQRASPTDARRYLDLAVESLDRLGEESRNRLEALQTLAQKACNYDGYRPRIAYEYARIAEVIGNEYASHKFPWDTTADTIARICPNSALAIVSRWRDRNCAWIGDTLPGIVEELLSRKLISPGLAMALRIMGDYFGNWNAERLAEGVFSQVGDHDARNQYAGMLVRDFDFDSGYWRQCSQLGSVFENYGLATEYLDLRREAGKAGEDKRDGFPSPPRRNTDPSPATDWDGITDGLDFTRPQDVEICFERFRGYDAPLYWDVLYTKMRQRVNVSSRQDHLKALLESPSLTISQTVEAIESAISEWQTSPAVVGQLKTLIEDYIRRKAPSLVHEREWWGVKSDTRKLAHLCPEAQPVMVEALISAAADRLDQCDADTLFALAEVCADVSGTEEAMEALLFGIRRFDDILKDADGDGPWRDDLSPPEEVEKSIAGMVHAGLATPDTAERWRAAHAVLRLCQLEETGVLESLFERVVTGDGAPFVDQELPFYDYHARFYFLMALARAATEVPKTVAKLVDEIKRVAFAETPHILLRKLARDALLAVEADAPGTLTTEEVERIDALVKSPFPVLSEEEVPSASGWSISRERVRSDDSFIFSYDFDRYWYGPPSEIFGITTGQFEDRALKWVEYFKGAYSTASGRWDDDPRRRRHVYRDQETWHSHGSYPKVDDLTFYLSYHAMFCTVGELLAERPMVARRWESDGLSDWTRSHLPSRKDGLWLVDRRDLALVEPMHQPDEIDREDWRWSVSPEDFERALWDAGDPGVLNVYGYWKRSDGLKEEAIRIQSALATPDTLLALVRALQTANATHELYIPDAGDQRGIRRPGFKLTGWVADIDSESGIDRFDPLAGKIRYPELRPSRAIERLFGLKAHDDRRTWSIDKDGDEPVMWSRLWGNWGDKRGEQGTEYGRRLSARLGFVLDLLKRVNRDLVVSVEIERAAGEKKDYQLERAYWVIYGLKSDGTLYKLRGHSSVGEATGSRITA